MKEYYTYAYLREDGTPYYIGKGKGNRIRDKNHRVSVPPKDRILFLKKKLSEQEALKHEMYMISVLGRKDIGTGVLRNLTDGGEGQSGFIHSEETKKKMREARKGKINPPLSEETRRKISEASKGKTHSEETRRKISEAIKGRKFSEETRRKMSEAIKGSKKPPRSEETKKKIREANTGKTHSEETKRKISEALKRHNNKRR